MWLRTTALEKQTCIKCLPLFVLGTVLSAFFKAAAYAVLSSVFYRGRPWSSETLGQIHKTHKWWSYDLNLNFKL